MVVTCNPLGIALQLPYQFLLDPELYAQMPPYVLQAVRALACVLGACLLGACTRFGFARTEMDCPSC